MGHGFSKIGGVDVARIDQASVSKQEYANELVRFLALDAAKEILVSDPWTWHEPMFKQRVHTLFARIHDPDAIDLAFEYTLGHQEPQVGVVHNGAPSFDELQCFASELRDQGAEIDHLTLWYVLYKLKGWNIDEITSVVETARNGINPYPDINEPVAEFDSLGRNLFKAAGMASPFPVLTLWTRNNDNYYRTLGVWDAFKELPQQAYDNKELTAFIMLAIYSAPQLAALFASRAVLSMPELAIALRITPQSAARFAAAETISDIKSIAKGWAYVAGALQIPEAAHYEMLLQKIDDPELRHEYLRKSGKAFTQAVIAWTIGYAMSEEGTAPQQTLRSRFQPRAQSAAPGDALVPFTFGDGSRLYPALIVPPATPLTVYIPPNASGGSILGDLAQKLANAFSKGGGGASLSEGQKKSAVISWLKHEARERPLADFLDDLGERYGTTFHSNTVWSWRRGFEDACYDALKDGRREGWSLVEVAEAEGYHPDQFRVLVSGWIGRQEHWRPKYPPKFKVLVARRLKAGESEQEIVADELLPLRWVEQQAREILGYTRLPHGKATKQAALKQVDAGVPPDEIEVDGEKIPAGTVSQWLSERRKLRGEESKQKRYSTTEMVEIVDEVFDGTPQTKVTIHREGEGEIRVVHGTVNNYVVDAVTDIGLLLTGQIPSEEVFAVSRFPKQALLRWAKRARPAVDRVIAGTKATEVRKTAGFTAKMLNGWAVIVRRAPRRGHF